ncbi:reprolysin-like metallopeptidase [Tenacibaculum geojense]|uniref:Reprolysin-like metallopeptidase n=1 Tax=Tenacibaculum geojense TaxID=915352 RepID=A0ABW3JTK4_9FLAO
MKKLLLFLLMLVNLTSISQNIWQQNKNTFAKSKISDNPKIQKNLLLKKNIFLNLIKDAPKRFSKNTSNVKISLPVDFENFEDFIIYETSNFSEKLSSKYPNIKSYVGISNKTHATVRLSYSSELGLNAYVSKNNGTLIIKPSELKNNNYSIYTKSDATVKSNFECNTIEKIKNALNSSNTQKNNLITNDGYLRKYRTAIATTGEFSNYFLTGNEVDDTERIATVLAAINNSLTRINGIFERDFGITMELIDENDSLIFLDGSQDPFNTGNYNNELQNFLDTTIGSNAYDVGHLFVFENRVYGSAGCIACVCTDGSKGSAFTAHDLPDSDNFNMIASHEFGHQYGGYHVQSSSSCRSSAGLQEVEPGSGSTIMSYAGICDPNVQESQDDYFNYVDIRDVIQWTRNDSSCAELIATGNNDPTANAGNDYTIPVSTAFVLEGNGFDTDNNGIITYCWEQNNPEDPFSSSTPQPTWEVGPLYRSRQPTSSPVRYMPQLSDVLEGNLTPTWEVTPSVGRTMNFVLTVRDNEILGSKTASDEMSVTVDDSAGPFIVTSQNNNEVWDVGETQTITWDVANTNQSPINANFVDIILSIDGGYTYPFTLASSVPNSGNAQIIVPEVTETITEARFMIKPTNNIFFAINSANINIQTSEFVMSFDEVNNSICQPNDAIYNFEYKTYLGFNEETTFSVENIPTGLTASFTPASATENGTLIQLTISGTENIEIGNYNLTIKGASSSIEKRTNINLISYNSAISTPNLISPTNNQFGVSLTQLLTWQNNDNAENYILEISESDNFTNLLVSETVLGNSYTTNILNYNTTYFWRVKANNTCGESNYSEVYTFTTVCNSPNNISITDIGTDTVTFEWSENGSANNWEIEIVPSGDSPSGVPTNINSNPATINNLNSNTNYDLYIRSNCSTNNTSEWIGPTNFKTLADFCNGDLFTDSGGTNGYYSNNETITTYISPINSDIVEVVFTEFELENGYDYLYIYDGNDINAPLIGQYSGNDSPGIIRSQMNQGLTFVFNSDSSVTLPGWIATVNCINITCPEPTNLETTAITSNSVELNWNATGSETEWELIYGESGFIPNQQNIVTTNNTNFTIENLQSGTNYDIYVRAVCDPTSNNDNSFWTGPLNITMPYDYCAGDHFYDTGGENGNYANNENYIKVIAPSQGYNSVTVIFDSFQLEGCCDYLFIYDGPNINAPLIGEFNGSNSPGQITSTHETGTLTFRFISDSSVTYTGWDARVICENINCFAPENVLVDPNSENASATITWDDNQAQAWEIEYGLRGFSQGTGTVVTATSNNYNLTNLDAPEQYDFYIRSICNTSTNETSTWESYSFNTNCISSIAPYHQSFNNNTLPACWISTGGEPWIFSLNADYSASNAGDHTEGGGTNYAWIDGSNPTGSDHKSTLTTDFINISEISNPTLQFSVFSVNDNDNTYNTLEVNLIDLVGETYSLLTLQGSTGSGWQTFSFNINDYPLNGPDIMLEFNVTENSPGTSYYNDILIDDIKVDSYESLSTDDPTTDIKNLRFYPNPVTNFINIENNNDLSKIQVFNMIGQKIIETSPNTLKTSLDLSGIQSGPYIIKVFSENKTGFFKVIKK